MKSIFLKIILKIKKFNFDYFEAQDYLLRIMTIRFFFMNGVIFKPFGRLASHLVIILFSFPILTQIVLLCEGIMRELLTEVVNTWQYKPMTKWEN